MGISAVSIGTLVNATSASFGQPTTAGNLLVAWVATNSSSATFNTTCSGTGWALAASGGEAFGWESIWYKADCGASEAAPGFGNFGSDAWIQLGEFSGAALSSPVGQTAGAVWWSQQAWQAGFSSYDSTGGQLLCAATYWGGSGVPLGGTVSVFSLTDGTGSQVTPVVSSAGDAFSVYAGNMYGVTGACGSQPDQIVMINSAAGALSKGTMAAFAPAVPPAAALAVTTTQMPGTYSNIPYAANVNVEGGVPPYTWGITAGSLSGSGLSLGTSTGAVTSAAGTPLASLTAGVYDFTVTVTDSASSTASQALSVTITAAPAVVASTTWPPTENLDMCIGTDPGMTGIGPENATYVGSNFWSGDGTATQTLYAQSAHQWYIEINIPGPGGIAQGSVETYPNSSAQWELIPRVNWQELDYLVSGWDVYMDSDDTVTASATYDLWMDQPLLNGSGSNLNGGEVMGHFLIINRGSGPYWATDLSFGGYTCGGIYVPETKWSLSYYKGSGTAFFAQGGPPGYFNSTVTSGAIDWKPIFQYLVDQGILAPSAKLKGFSLGFEICNTQNVNRLFAYNNCYWHGLTGWTAPVPVPRAAQAVRVPARIGGGPVR